MRNRSKEPSVTVTLVLGLTLMVAVGTVHATAYFVSKTADTLDGTCDGDCSLREAIVAANAHAGADYVILPAGTLTLTITGSGEDGCLTGDLDVTETLYMTGQGSANTVVDATGLGDRVFHVIGPNATMAIGGLSITGGNPPTDAGAGIRNEGGTVSIGDVMVVHNLGDGIASFNGDLTVTNGSLIGDNSGAGINFFVGSLTVTDSTITGNQVSGTYGGGIGAWSVDGLTISGSTISWNTSDLGGGGLLVENALAADISNSTFYGNSGDLGSAILAWNNSVTLNSVTIVDLHSSGSSLTAHGSALTMISTIISGRCLTESGAILASAGGNLESPGDTCNLGGGDQLNVAAPLLSQLGDFGGETRTVLPLPGSPAISHGSNDYCLTEDQRGELRGDGWCDAGAVERQSGDPLPVFLDGFESGSTSSWSSDVP